MNRRRFLALAAGAAAVGIDAARLPSASAQTSRKMRAILLGTAGGPTPKKTRSAPASVVLVNDAAYVVDCGNGVARQLVLAGVPLTSIKDVFITHHHSDHNADYGTLLLLAWAAGLRTHVDTWGPPPLARMTKLFFEMSAADMDVRIADEGHPPLIPLVEPHELTGTGAVMRDDNVKVTCAVVRHPMVAVALAYRFDGPDRSIVFSGDTTRSDALIALARNADVLVHEVLYAPAYEEQAKTGGSRSTAKHVMESHTAVEEAGKIAAEAGVKTLVLSHFVPSEGDADAERSWQSAAKAHFSGQVIVGSDLLEI